MNDGRNIYRKFLALLIVFQLLNTFCARQMYRETSFPNILGQEERTRLQDFIDGGIEKMPGTGNARPEEIIRTAEKYLGVPHCMGGTTMKCMDCSGLVMTVFAAHNIQLPHQSEEQARFGILVSRTDALKKGDMVFFIRTYKTDRLITHSGIYIGNNQFIHASSSRGVTITSLDNPWWAERFIFGTRVFR